ncbi:MAG: hypothetical protein KJO52_08445 [Maribacter sp.]|nr:hypothetical protein [Maribacter sp.]
MSIIFLTVFLTTSCEKNSDLLVEYVLSENLQNEQLDEFAGDHASKTATDLNAVPDAMANDLDKDQKNLNGN